MSQSDMAKYFTSMLIYFQEPEVSEKKKKKAWELNI